MSPAVKTTLKANIQDGQGRVRQKFTGVAHAYFLKKIEITLLNILFEKPAEGRNGHTHLGSHLRQGYGRQVILERKLKNGFNRGID